MICLIDFRLAKSLATTDKTYTLCGTPDYLSPEQVTCAGHDSSADLWGLGVLLWEVSAGEGPWGTDANEMNTYKKITDHTAGGLTKPGHFEPELGEAIDALLAPDPKARLGAQGFDALKALPWFSEINWAKLQEGAVPSPLAQAAVTHMRSQLSASAGRPGDAALTELAGTTEFTGDSSWFADY